MQLISLNLEQPRQIANQTSTLATPSSDFVESLIGVHASAGKVVTRETALRVAAFLSGVKMLANDIAKMPLILRETRVVAGRQRTQAAIGSLLYSLLKDCPNPYQTSYQMRWFLASQLLMNSNCYCQKVTDQRGQLLGLIPLNAWSTTPFWDRSTDPPTLKYRYEDAGTHIFNQSQIWHVSAMNFDGIGITGTPIITLAKEALSLLMGAEEVAGKQFANGLGMGGFISFPADSGLDEKQAQNVVNRLRDDFAGSKNAGKFSILPGGGTWQKMSWNASESQVLDSRKYSEQTVVRMLGGAPLLVKLGLGEAESTYASSQAFIEDYFTTSLLPYTTAIEQSITRDLIPKEQWGTVYAKHSADIILRGSPKERAETNAARIMSAQMTPNEARVTEDLDTIEGGDFLIIQASSSIFDPATGEWFIPGQKVPEAQAVGDSGAGSSTADEASSEGDEPDSAGTGDGSAAPAKPTPAKKPSNAATRLRAISVSLVDRVMRKEAKAGPDAKFTAHVLNVSQAEVEAYVASRKDQTDIEARAALLALAMGDGNAQIQ